MTIKGIMATRASQSVRGPLICDRHVLDKRNDTDLSPALRNAIQTITAEAETLPVGTFKYRVFKFPGDVDLFEQLKECCTYNVAKLKAANRIQSITQDVLDNPNMIFIEFKAGYDFRFKLYTGVMNDNYEDYDPCLIRRDWNNLYSAGLLTIDQYKIGCHKIKDRPTFGEVLDLNEYLRMFWVVRWTAAEVLTGAKKLPGNYTLYLDLALTKGSVVKLDTIAKTETRYVEMTNFFMISQKDKYGNEVVLSEELKDYEQSLLGDVYKYYEYKTLKSVKRLWMYLAFKGQICDMSLFTPLFESKIAYASQVVADIEVVLDLLNSDTSYDIRFLFDTISYRLSSLVGTYLDAPFKSSDPEIIHAYLLQAKGTINERVNINTQHWLAENCIDLFKLI